MRSGSAAPFRYSAALWAIAAGLVVWGEIPDLWTWTGTAIVTSATILRESRLRAASRLARQRGQPLAATAHFTLSA